MDTPPPEDSSSSPDLPPATRSARFLGDSDAVRKGAPRAPAARVLTMVSALVLLLILLLATVLSFRNQLGDRVLITVAVPSYDSPLLTPLEFVEQDVDRIRSASGLRLTHLDGQPELSIFSTESELSFLMQEILPEVRQDTLIVSVRMHAVADVDYGGLYLLASDADPLRPRQGIRCRDLLQAVADSRASNKLLLLDIGQSPQRLHPTPSDNSIREHLEALFSDLTDDTDLTAGLFLICATGDHQSSWSSVSVQHSLFGGLSSYCLHGGAAADGAGQNGQRDGLISAREMSAFLERSIAEWSLAHTSTVQTPFHLPTGNDLQTDDDFFVAPVDELLTLESYFSEREPLARAGESDNERRQEESSDQPSEDGNDPELTLLPTTKTLTDRLFASWQRRQQLESTSAPVRRPRHWALYQQALHRAELLLLAGRLDDATVVLDTIVIPLEEDLETAPVELIQNPWSAAFTDLVTEASGAARWSEAIQSAVDLPTSAAFDRLRGVPFVEAELLRQARGPLATGTTDEDASWADPELLQLALGTRGLSEDVARLACAPAASEETQSSMPELLPVLADGIERSDRARVSAELELTIGRLEIAREQFEFAADHYELVQRNCETQRDQLHKLHVTLIEAESLAQWLSAAGRDSAWRSETQRQLVALLRGTSEFRQQPQPERLLALAGICQVIHDGAESAALEAVAMADRVELRAALELPFLNPDLRREVLSSIIDQVDAPTAIVSRRGFESAFEDRNATGDELARAFTTALALDSPESATESFYTRLAELNADPLALPPGETGYEQFITHLVRAPFQSLLIQRTGFRSTVTDELVARMTMDHLLWQLSRLDAVRSATGADISEARSVIVNNLQALNPSFQESRLRSRRPFAISDVRIVAAEPDPRLQLTFQVSGSIELTAADNPLYVIDWFALRDHWYVLDAYVDSGRGAEVAAVDSLPASTGPVAESSEILRRQLPLQELVTGTNVKIVLELEPVAGVNEVQVRLNEQISGWIETADGSRYWAPVPFRIDADLLTPLRLAVVGPGGDDLPDVIKVFPNQTLPLDVQVHGQRADVESVRVEVLSGSAEHSYEASLISTGVWGGINAAFQMPVIDAALELRALAGSEVVDSRRLTIEVLNPRRSFSPELVYDVATRTVSATIRRLDQSAVPEPVPVQLTVHNVGVEGGNLLGELPTDGAHATLNATLSADTVPARIEVSLGVCGVPGMFHFRVDSATGAVARWQRTHIDLRTPDAGATYAYSIGQATDLSVGVLADGEDECVVNIGLDRNGDGYLQTDERIARFDTWAGKTVGTNLVAGGDPTELAINSIVSDVSARIPAVGLVGPQQILAQLVSGSRLLSASRTVYFVQTPPGVTIEFPRQNGRIAYGDPLRVGLRSESPSYSAIERIEVGVDRNNNGEWDDGETLNPTTATEELARPFGPSNRTFGVYDSRELVESEEDSAESSEDDPAEAGQEPSDLPRRLVLMARANTPVEDLGDPSASPRQDVSAIARRTIELISQADKPLSTGQISGYVVTADGLGQRNVPVVLGERMTLSDDDGYFLLRQVPVGLQVLEARKGRRAGTVEVDVVADQTTDVEIVIVR